MISHYNDEKLVCRKNCVSITNTDKSRKSGSVTHQSDPHGEAGYTLLELLIVLIILGLLVGLAGPAVLNQFGKAKSETAAIETNQLLTNLEFFRVDVGRFPTQEEGLNALLVPPEGAPNWAGPYVERESNLTDPWGNEYQYRPLPELNTVEVISLGADNVEGGTGENRDLSSRN